MYLHKEVGIRDLSFNVSEPLNLQGALRKPHSALRGVVLAQLLLFSSHRPIPTGGTGMIHQHLLCCPAQLSIVQAQHP